ncbi:MAG: hypothetical protein K9K30_15350, partial [Burkholderiaceae bacterium]|nr:hypothetical protein [Burkholderiaceae bacterium]
MTMTTAATEEMFGDMSLWQTMLDHQRELFIAMDAGSRLGFVSREASGILPGKRLEGVQVVATEVPLMVWEIANGGMSARIERFAGIAPTPVDLLLVADQEAMDTMLAELDGDMLKTIKRLIRRGNIMFFVFKN